VTRIRPAAWLMATVALFLLAVAGYALLVHASPQYYWSQIDTAVYRDGGIAVRNQPAMLYALGLGPAKLPFIYTPFAALLFAAGSGASFATWQVGLAVLTIGLLPVVAYLSLGLAGRPAGLARAAAAFAIAAVGLWLEPVAMTLFFGQINLVLLALVVGDLALPDRIKGKGIGIGLAAGIKLTPLIFIPYLLFTRRVKAAAVSALTFAVTVGFGFALLPHASAEVLRAAVRLYHDLTQILRLCVSERFNPETAGDDLLHVMARAGDAPDFSSLEARIKETQAEVRRVFKAVVERR